MSVNNSAVRLSPEHFNDSLKLFNNVFDRDESIDFWTYKHLKNPFGPSEFFGLFDGDRLVGMSAFMPIEYIKGDTRYRALITCESAVDASYRGQGIYTKVLSGAEEWAADNGYAFLMAFPNPNSYPGFKKQGFATTGQADSWGKIMNLGRFISHAQIKRPLASLCLLKGFFGNIFRKTDTSQYSVTEVDTGEFLRFNDSLKCFKCNFTEEFLAWKLGGNGHIYRINKGSDISAYVIVHNGRVEYIRDAGAGDFDWLPLLSDMISSDNGVAELCIDSRLLPEDRILGSGFVTRRDTPHYRVLKGLNETTASEGFCKDIIFQNIEED